MTKSRTPLWNWLRQQSAVGSCSWTWLIVLGGLSSFGGAGLARQLVQTLAADGQLGFLDNQDRETVLNPEAQPAALADQAILLKKQARIARIHWAAQDFKKFRTDHLSYSAM